MNVTPENVECLALQKEDENWKFRSFVKCCCELSDPKLDKLVADIADNVWTAIDCTACARCCITLRPSFPKKTQEHLAKKLSLSLEQFRERYLELNRDEGGALWQIRKSPCPFLENNKCSIYEDRPADCRNYPYVHKPQFRSRMWGMLERTVTCPNSVQSV
jgi:Fe-S-cluster containining protein